MGLRHISAAANHLVDHSQTLCKLINTPCTCHTHTLALAHTPSHGCTNARILLVSGMYISSVSQLARCGERDVKSLIQWVFFLFIAFLHPQFSAPCHTRHLHAHAVQKPCSRLSFLNVSIGNNPFLFHFSIPFLVRNLRLYRQGC